MIQRSDFRGEYVIIYFTCSQSDELSFPDFKEERVSSALYLR